MHNVVVICDADHEACKHGERRFAVRKLLRPQKGTAGLHSSARCCYLLFFSFSLFMPLLPLNRSV